MMALQLLPILQLIIIFYSPTTFSYPIYGTKRYGGAPATQQQVVPPHHTSGGAASSWGGHLQPYQQMMRAAQRYPINYYEMYPYNQNYGDDYYYPDAMNYPVYYPPARASKYEVYQAVLPYYYDRPLMRANYGYYGYDDTSDDEQQNDREQREEAQPIGQEMYYENDPAVGSDENLNDVNAAFLQNLIMTQMYKDSLEKQYPSQFKDGLSKQFFKDGLDKPYTSQEKQLIAQYKGKQYKTNVDKQHPLHASQYQDGLDNHYQSPHDQQYMSQYQDDLKKQFTSHPKQYPNLHDQYMSQYQDKQYSSQYKDDLDKHSFDDTYASEYNPSGTTYGDDFYANLDDYAKQEYFKDDEDELELKQLAKPAPKPNNKSPTPQERQHWFQRNSNKKTNTKQQKGNDDYYWESKRNFGKNTNVFVDRKVAVKIGTSTGTEAPVVSTTMAPKRGSRGMKEEVLLRPATPAKHPFATSLMNMMNKKDLKERQRTPSVYDTIKHMLDIEKSLDNEHDELKPAMRKRIISSEDSLTHQLSVLKKQK